MLPYGRKCNNLEICVKNLALSVIQRFYLSLTSLTHHLSGNP